MFYKRRDYTRIVNGRNPIVAHEYLGDDRGGQGHSGGGRHHLLRRQHDLDLARELKKRKANRIFAAATFALFTNGLDVLQSRPMRRAIIEPRDLHQPDLPHRPSCRTAPWFIEADMSKYISYIVATLEP